MLSTRTIKKHFEKFEPRNVAVDSANFRKMDFKPNYADCIPLGQKRFEKFEFLNAYWNFFVPLSHLAT